MSNKKNDTFDEIRNRLSVIESMQLVNKMTNSTTYRREDILMVVEDINLLIEDALNLYKNETPYRIDDEGKRVLELNTRKTKVYDIGDRVKIKSWDRMVSEYGLIDTGLSLSHIDTPTFVFSERMRYLCKSTQSIETFLKVGDTEVYEYTLLNTPFTFTAEMFE